MQEFLIKNGTVVFENDAYPADILVRCGKIAGIFTPGEYSVGDEQIDATGLYIFPGSIDPHMHLGLYKKLDEAYRYDSAREAIGGLTTLIDYHRGKGNYFETVREEIRLAQENSYIDFAISLGLCAKKHLSELRGYATELGITSFKFFFDKQDIADKFYGIPKEEALTLDKADFYDMLKYMREIDPRLLLCVHCEEPDLFRAITNKLMSQYPDTKSLEVFESTRPGFVEANSVASSMHINNEVGGNMYIVHVSSAQSLKMYTTLTEILPNGKVALETCPQYLLLDKFASCGQDAKVNPPLRTREDIEALWEGIRNGSVKTIGTDNVPVDRANKYIKGTTLWDNYVGFSTPGMILPMLVSEGYHKRGIPLWRLSQVNSINTARLFCLAEKGEIKVGHDADLALVDLDWEREITPELFGFSDFSIYEGMKFKGWPRYTISRGEIIQKDGKVIASPGRGKYIARKL